MTLNSLFKVALVATLAIKIALAYILPLSGDEAYFVVWAKYLDFGYYDHPPMVGWILHVLSYFGNSEVLLRLPAIVLSTLIGFGIYLLIKPYDENKAALIATLFLVSPINVLNILITTDTPLILCVFVSATFLFKALQNQNRFQYAWSGVFLGLAFLSKYFAVLLGLSYLIFFIFSEKSKKKTYGFVILVLAALPLVLINLYWNYTHCWDNILFNLYTRNEGENFSLEKIAVFLGIQAYLMTPPVIYYLFKHRGEFKQIFQCDEIKLFKYIFLVSMSVFALLSLRKDIGLHWLLAFYPFFYLLLSRMLSQDELGKSLKFMLGFSLLHLAAIIVISALPMETWKQNKLYDGIVFMFENDKIVERVRPFEQQGFLLASDGYTPAAIISYHYGKNFFVFGEGSHYARQDDIITDFRQFTGRDILIVKKTLPDLVQYEPYFQRLEVRQFEIRNVTYYFVLGYNFNFTRYKESVLRPIKEKYYNIPSYLPYLNCYFCQKYFPGEDIW